jgi:acetylglutamate/LysW-gamma-L-alpha-aminoadipate kinase
MLILIKAGGNLLKDIASLELVSDLKTLAVDHNLILVHGGGFQVTETAAKLGKEQRFVISPQGFRSRYTDKETIDIFTMVMAGKINKKLVLALESQGIPAVGLSGLDGLLLKAQRKKRLIIVDERGRKKVIDGGYTGKINEVNVNLLSSLIAQGYVPVVSPIAISEEFEPLNVDGDRAAAIIAGMLKANRLILLTDVKGLILKGKIVPKLAVAEAAALLPHIGKGMSTKIHAALEALNQGVEEVLVAPGFMSNPISSALKHESGTVLTNE